MWQKTLKKTVYLLNVDNYGPEITAISYPLIYHYARKIGGEVFQITERKFPDWPPVYEKLQIYQLAQEHGNDWNIYVDSDALLHPDLMDMTAYLDKSQVSHWGNDVAEYRWHTDRYFWRDGRHLGSCNWFTIASDWCIELWKPLDDLTREEAVGNIWPIVQELKSVITADHLIDDFVLSRNIAKYGLKFKTFENIKAEIGRPQDVYLYHEFTIPIDQKVVAMNKVLKAWRMI